MDLEDSGWSISTIQMETADQRQAENSCSHQIKIWTDFSQGSAHLDVWWFWAYLNEPSFSNLQKSHTLLCICNVQLSHNYGKSPFLMGQSTISMAMFNIFLYVYQRVSRLSSSLIWAQSWWGEFFLKGLRYLRTRDKLRRVEAPGAFKDLWDFCWAPNKPDKVYNIYNISLYKYIYTGVVLHWKTCLEIQRSRVWLDRAGGTAAA